MRASLSYREKSLYASLAAELLVYGPYFFLHQQNSINKVAAMILAIIVLQIALQLAIADADQVVAVEIHPLRQVKPQQVDLICIDREGGFLQSQPPIDVMEKGSR